MAIEQHPIPQDVAGYKFRLIGEMTIKQFSFLAAGIIAGLIVYSLPLPFFFKYPLAAAFVMLGAGIAFLPVEGRPMDKWLIAFIKSVYSPTQYIWQKQAGAEVITAKVSPPAPKLERSETPPSGAPAPTPVTAPIAPPITPQPVTPISQAKSEPALPVKPTPLPAPRSEAGLEVLRNPAYSRGITPTPPPNHLPPPAAVLPIPFTPTTPNTLVGMTLTPDSKILDGCLIEIKAKGLSLRATKSNRLGQFLFAKPLENGLYQVYTEKPGFAFDTYSLQLTGQIVKPLKLQAKP